MSLNPYIFSGCAVSWSNNYHKLIVHFGNLRRRSFWSVTGLIGAFGPIPNAKVLMELSRN